MLKKEIIWREILYQGLEKKNRQLTQKEIAGNFNISLSTVFNALKIPRKAGAIKVTGRNFILENPEKFLYLWATFRNLKKDIIYQTNVRKPVLALEGLMPPKVVFGAYSAYRRRFKEAPADYDKVYIYSVNLTELKKRFPPKKGYPNLIILKADSFLKKYGEITSLGQTFVDLWNLEEWYAKDYLEALKQKINELLS